MIYQRAHCFQQDCWMKGKIVRVHELVDSFDKSFHLFTQKVFGFQQEHGAKMLSLFTSIKSSLDLHFKNQVLVTLTGSVLTGLYTQDSNINVQVQPKAGVFFNRGAFERDVHSFARALSPSKTRFLSLVKTHSLITLNLDFSNKEVEVKFLLNSKKLLKTNDEIVSYYLERHSLSKPLFVFLKGVLTKTGLLNPKTKGMTTFSLFLLIIFFLEFQA